ncbi:MAG: protein-export chaperone SecB, partial [Pseudomonadota bacterium]|nr:protein-export chaperone SecB [Pseudomonadota bacterium]
MNEELKSGFKFLSQYVKDLSFENPKVPRKLPHMMAKPDINVSVNVNA